MMSLKLSDYEDIDLEKYVYNDSESTEKNELEALPLNIKLIDDVSQELCIEELSVKQLSLGNPSWNRSDIVAKKINGDETYTAEDLIDIPVLATDSFDETDILFYGQYNEKMHWNGECITNIYMKGILYLVTDAVYEDGKLNTYRQIILTESEDSATKEWIVAERTCEGTYNSGYTQTFSRGEDYRIKYNFHNAETKDVLFYENLRVEIENSNDAKLTSFYRGNTSEGVYNDKTGNAFWILFDENEKLFVLYKGNFVDGYPKDNNAWELVYDTVGYFFYEGPYDSGRINDLPKNPYVSLDYAKELVSDIDYDFSNLWYEE